MAYAFPIDLDTFFRDLDMTAHGFDLAEAIEQLTLGSGEVLTSQHGTRLWGGTVDLAVHTLAAHENVMARLRVLQRPGASFMVSATHHERPGAGTGVLDGVQNGREVRLAGLAPFAVVPRGSFVSFSYGSSPTRYAFHQVTEEMTAGGAGVTGWGEVVPPVRPGYAAGAGGASVLLAVPRLKAVLLPGSLRPAAIRRGTARGVSFGWRQTLR